MKNIPLRRKVRLRPWLANFVALSLLLQSVALPSYAYPPSFCDRALKIFTHRDPPPPADQTEAQKNEELRIRKENANVKLRPLNNLEVDSLVERYTKTPEELAPWLQDWKIRKSRAATSRSEDLAATILTIPEGAEAWDFLHNRRNIWVKTRSSWSLTPIIFGDLTDEASADRQWLLSFKFGARLVNLFKGRGYAAYNILFPRDITYTDSNGSPTLDIDRYLVSLARALHVVRDGTEIGSVKFMIRDLKRQKEGLVAAGTQAFQTSLTDLFFENNFTLEPFRKVVAKYVEKAFPDSPSIQKYLEKVEWYSQDTSRVDQDDSDLSDSAKKILKEDGAAAFFVYLINTTAEKEIPKKIFNFLAKAAAMGTFMWWATNYFSTLFFPAGIAKKFNGKMQPENPYCKPGALEDQTIMGDDWSPFDPKFIAVRIDKAHYGELNPCDPDHSISDFYNKILGDNPDDDQNHFGIWYRNHPDIIAPLKDKIRNQYKYTAPNYSACALYYGIYTRCPENLVKP